MVSEQSGQLIARLIPIKRLDRRADVILIFQQSPGDRSGIVKIGQGADDVVACVRDVLLSQFNGRLGRR
jgi:hypothetical protein